MTTGTATPPTEAEIRAAIEAYATGPGTETGEWDIGLWGGPLESWMSDLTGAFETFVANEHIADDDFSVFSDAYRAALDELRPDINAALRPLMIEAQTRAAVAFFERFPWAPLRDAA